MLTLRQHFWALVCSWLRCLLWPVVATALQALGVPVVLVVVEQLQAVLLRLFKLLGDGEWSICYHSYEC